MKYILWITLSVVSIVSCHSGAPLLKSFADLVILDQDLTTIPPTAIRDVRVVRTIVGGETIYQQ